MGEEPTRRDESDRKSVWAGLEGGRGVLAGKSSKTLTVYGIKYKERSKNVYSDGNYAIICIEGRRGQERLTLGLKAMSLRIISTVKTPVKTILRMSMA